MAQQPSPDLDALWSGLKLKGQEQARSTLVERYVGLVKYVAARMAVGLPHYVELSDLHGAGTIGLIQAIDNFDLQRGNKFETYAIPRIRGAILDELRAQDWFPRSVRRKARQLEGAYAALETRLGRAATDQEVARHLELSLEEFQRLVGQVAVATLVPLDGELESQSGGGGTRLSDSLADPNVEPADEKLEAREMRELVADTLGELPERERLVLSLYYYEELTLKEIGEVLDVTESRVCQIHTKAIFRLRGKTQRKLTHKPIWQLGREVAETAEKTTAGAPSFPVGPTVTSVLTMWGIAFSSLAGF